MYITYHVNTFNRLPFLQNLLKSFQICNEYDKFEWVIMDYGSKDGTRDFLFDAIKQYEWLTVVFGNEAKYFEILNSKGLGPKSKRLQAHTIFGYSRNVARQIGRGDAFIDIADDHQFVRKGNWVQDFLSIEKDINVNVGKQVGSIVYRGLSLSRLSKANNERYECLLEGSSSYFRTKHKHYDDYHFMRRNVYEMIGKYMEIDSLDKDREAEWKTGEPTFDHYRDYLQRAEKLGVAKAFMKYPYVVDFPNNANYKDFNKNELFVQIFEKGEMEKKFQYLNRPVSSDEIFREKL